MATRYHTKVNYIELPDGRVVITTEAPPAGASSTAMTMIGATVAECPCGPVTRAEADDWQGNLFDRGFIVKGPHLEPHQGEPVTAEEYLDADTPGVAVDLELQLVSFEDRPTLRVIMKNVGTVPIPKPSVWVHFSHTPQPIGGTGGTSRGICLGLAYERGGRAPTLEPGTEAAFFLNREGRAEVLHRLATISVDDTSIVMLSHELPLGAVPPATVAEVLGGLE
jgi:hypothetical protein